MKFTPSETCRWLIASIDNIQEKEWLRDSILSHMQRIHPDVDKEVLLNIVNMLCRWGDK